VIGLWVALAGGAGALARFTLDSAVRTRRATTFPYATLVINVSGSLLLGVLTGLVLFHGGAGTVRQVVGTGFCGGYTTFSAVSFETIRLVQQGRLALAWATAAGNLLLTLGAGALGLLLTHR
jgi:CrcB protein